MGFKEKIQSFFYKRNGFDKFNKVLLGLYILIRVINIFLKSSFLNFLSGILLLYILFRALSKNIYKRQYENDNFMRYWCRVESIYNFNKRRLKEIKTHRYKRCPNCRSMLRLKRRFGKHTALCPVCKKEFPVKIFI